MNGTFHEYIYKVVMEQKHRQSESPDKFSNTWGLNFYGEYLLEGLWSRQAMTAAQDFEKICTEYCTNLINKETAIFNMQSLGLPPLVLTEALEEMYNRREEYYKFMSEARVKENRND